MIIHVAQFSSKLTGRKLSIANSMPKGVRMQTVKELFPTLATIITPGWGLVAAYKEHRISWAVYARIYGESLQKVNLTQAMHKLCNLAGTDELVLCCWEKADDECCHRKLLYDALPESIKGERQ